MVSNSLFKAKRLSTGGGNLNLRKSQSQSSDGGSLTETGKAQENTNNLLNTLLGRNGEDERELFRAFLEKELSDENLDFWDACQSVLDKVRRYNMTDKKHRGIYWSTMGELLDLSGRFLEEACIQPVNLPANSLSKLKSYLVFDAGVCTNKRGFHLRDFNFDALTATLQEAQDHIRHLMESDTYPRYLDWKPKKMDMLGNAPSNSLASTGSTSTIPAPSHAATQRALFRRQSSTLSDYNNSYSNTSNISNTSTPTTDSGCDIGASLRRMSGLPDTIDKHRAKNSFLAANTYRSMTKTSTTNLSMLTDEGIDIELKLSILRGFKKELKEESKKKSIA